MLNKRSYSFQGIELDNFIEKPLQQCSEDLLLELTNIKITFVDYYKMHMREKKKHIKLHIVDVIFIFCMLSLLMARNLFNCDIILHILMWLQA